MTTLSQFIGPEENLSLSFHSTPCFNDGNIVGSKMRQANSNQSIIEECNTYNENQEESNVKTWSQEQQNQHSKLFFKINEPQSHQNTQSNYHTFRQNHNCQSKQNKDYTPLSLLDKLRDFKHEKENRLQNYSLRQPLSFTSRPRFSLITLKNPAFKLFEDIKKERLVRLNSCGLGWYDKTLYEDKGLGEFYQMPDQNSVVEYESWSSKSSMEIKSNRETSKEHQSNDKSNGAKIFKKTKNNKISCSSNTIIDQIIAQSSIIEEEQDKQNCQKSLKDVDENTLKESIKVDAQIQTEEGLKVNTDYQTEDFAKLSFEQLSNKIIKHLTVLEAINNSLLAENNSNKGQERESRIRNDDNNNFGIGNNAQKSQTLLISQECQKDKQTEGKSSHMDESKYFRLSQSQFVITPAQKLKLLQKFNKQQNEMFKKLFESMISCKSSGNSRMSVFRDMQKIQQRVFQSQICRKEELQISQSQRELKTDAKQSEISFQSPMVRQSGEVTFLYKPSNHMNDSQFGNLQKLMRDRGMKQSILGSNQEHTSSNSESLLSIVDSEITEKFQKFNPETLKKIKNNDQ